MDIGSSPNGVAGYPDDVSPKPRGRFISSFTPVPPTDPAYREPATSSSRDGTNGHDSKNNMGVMDHPVVVPRRSAQFYDYGDFDIPFWVPGQQLDFFSPNQVTLDLALQSCLPCSQEAPPPNLPTSANPTDAQKQLTRELEIFEDTLNRVRLANASSDHSINPPETLDPDANSILEEFEDDIQNDEGIGDLYRILEVACKGQLPDESLGNDPTEDESDLENFDKFFEDGTLNIKSPDITTEANTSVVNEQNDPANSFSDFADISTSGPSNVAVVTPFNINDPCHLEYENDEIIQSEAATITPTAAEQAPVYSATTIATECFPFFFQNDQVASSVNSTDPVCDPFENTFKPNEMIESESVVITPIAAEIFSVNFATPNDTQYHPIDFTPNLQSTFPISDSFDFTLQPAPLTEFETPTMTPRSAQETFITPQFPATTAPNLFEWNPSSSSNTSSITPANVYGPFDGGFYPTKMTGSETTTMTPATTQLNFINPTTPATTVSSNFTRVSSNTNWSSTDSKNVYDPWNVSHCPTENSGSETTFMTPESLLQNPSTPVFAPNIFTYGSSMPSKNFPTVYVNINEPIAATNELNKYSKYETTALPSTSTKQAQFPIISPTSSSSTFYPIIYTRDPSMSSNATSAAPENTCDSSEISLQTVVEPYEPETVTMTTTLNGQTPFIPDSTQIFSDNFSCNPETSSNDNLYKSEQSEITYQPARQVFESEAFTMTPTAMEQTPINPTTPDPTEFFSNSISCNLATSSNVSYTTPCYINGKTEIALALYQQTCEPGTVTMTTSQTPLVSATSDPNEFVSYNIPRVPGISSNVNYTADKYIFELREIKCEPAQPSLVPESVTKTPIATSQMPETPATTATTDFSSGSFPRNFVTTSNATSIFPLNIRERSEITLQPAHQVLEPETVTMTPTTKAQLPMIPVTSDAPQNFSADFPCDWATSNNNYTASICKSDQSDLQLEPSPKNYLPETVTTTLMSTAHTPLNSTVSATSDYLCHVTGVFTSSDPSEILQPREMIQIEAATTLSTTTVKTSSVSTTSAATQTLPVKLTRNRSNTTTTAPENICEPVDVTEEPSEPATDPEPEPVTITPEAVQPPIRTTTPAVTQFIHNIYKCGPSDTLTVPLTDPSIDVTVEPAKMSEAETATIGLTSQTTKKPATSGLTQFLHAVYQCGPSDTLLVPLTDNIIVSDTAQVTIQPVEMNEPDTDATTPTGIVQTSTASQTPTATFLTPTTSQTPTTALQLPSTPTATYTTTFYHINSEALTTPTVPVQVTNVDRDGTIVKRSVLHPPTKISLMSVDSLTNLLPLIKSSSLVKPRSNPEVSGANVTILVNKQQPPQIPRQRDSYNICKTLNKKYQRKSPPCKPVRNKLIFHHYDGPVIPKKRKTKKVAEAAPPPQNKTEKSVSYFLEQQKQQIKWQLEFEHKLPKILLPARPKVKTVVVPIKPRPPTPPTIPTISRTITIGNTKRKLSFEVPIGNGRKAKQMKTCSQINATVTEPNPASESGAAGSTETIVIGE